MLVWPSRQSSSPIAAIRLAASAATARPISAWQTPVALLTLDAPGHSAPAQPAQAPEKKTVVIDPKVLLRGNEDGDKVQLKLILKRQISKDSFVGTFGFDTGKVLGVPAGYHLSIHVKDEEGKEIRRTYTPLSLSTTAGHVELLIKVYHPCPEFPKGGALTQLLDKVKVGEEITVSGPRGKHTYLGRGSFEFKNEDQKEVRHFKKLTFLAGGSGITPFISVMRHIALDKDDQTEVTLLFSNKTEDDVLLHDELSKYAAEHKLKYVWTITREAPKDPHANTGRINLSLLEKSIPKPSEDHIVFVCGPSEFNKTMKSILQLMNHEDSNIK